MPFLSHWKRKAGAAVFTHAYVHNSPFLRVCKALGRGWHKPANIHMRTMVRHGVRSAQHANITCPICKDRLAQERKP